MVELGLGGVVVVVVGCSRCGRGGTIVCKRLEFHF